MAKSLLKLEARKLRSKGLSVKKISEYLYVSKSTASIWVRDIIISVAQLETLKRSELYGAELGRMRGALLQKQRRLKLIEESKSLGIQTISDLSERELLIAGLAHYWGEGSKKSQEVQFCNSDPKMIQFMLHWFQKCLNIELNEIKCCVGINEAHYTREKVVKEYWSKITGIPLEQFRKTSFKKVKNVKFYSNFNEHYGTLSIDVMKSSRFYFKILGLIDGLFYAGCNRN